MEFLALLMSGLLVGLSPFSFILEQVSGRQISQRLQDAESFEVRVDNIPSHQFIGGKIDRVQIASRGVELVPGLRLAVLELETDALNLDLAQLRSGQPGPNVLREPLQTGMRFVLTEADVNEALRSPRVKTLLQPVINRLLTAPGSTRPERFQLETATLDFLGNNRFQFMGDISRIDAATGETEQSTLRLAFTLGLASGSQFQWQDLEGSIDDQPLPPPLLSGFAQAFSQRFNLRIFQNRGLTARFLQLDADSQELQGAMFIRFTPPEPAS
ncbi:hypothetical protein NIES970_21490 [[Synechococcus] sp. NIES-970]|uniref:LmeA family phospholipid-binding protein n=1 Tax=Picosynechococcus sp. NKBG15041c TaxID=1407650 RepID=UPI00041A32DE|nr:DUF2993 domain-containing protein [Picosynechococcus sp. NKBG15041c]BAW97203.1 hypothetical protein NIES970_21490 [[Synechococcus] sp. NIES-970]